MKIERCFFTSPESLGLRREPAAATLFHFNSEADARQVKREYSQHYMSLDGEWKFSYTEDPCSISEDTFAENFDDSAFENISVPDCWVMRDSVPDNPHYTNVQMPFEKNSPEVPEKNPTGIYRRKFEVANYDPQRRYLLQFEGAESCFFAYVNGHFAGSSKDSRGTSEFDVSEFLHDGTNTVCVVVLKWSDGTYLEDQDYWYMPGLSRSVALIYTCKSSITVR